MALDESALSRLFDALASEQDERGRGLGGTDASPGSQDGDPLDLMRQIASQDDLGDPRVRAAMAEVADAVAHADPDATLSASLRRAVIAAQRARVADAPRVACPPTPSAARSQAPERATGPVTGPAPGTVPDRAVRRLPSMARIAALVVLALGVGLFLVSRREAAATLRVAGVDRLASDGSRREVSSARALPAGTALAGDDGEFLVVTLPSGGRLVLGSGDEVAIVGVPRGFGGHDARLALVAGEVRLDATTRHQDAGGDIQIDIGHQRVFALLDGRALLRRVPGGVVVVPDAAAAFRLEDEGLTRSSRAPLFVPFEGAPSPFDEPIDAQGAFEAWPRLMIAPRTPDDGRRVAPRRWRVVSGPFERSGRSLRLSPSSPSAIVAWAPFAALATADVLALDTEGGPASVRVLLDGAEVLPVPTEPRGTTHVPLPPGWLDQLGGRELQLEFTWPEEPSPRLPLELYDATFMRASQAARSNAETLAPTGESDELR